MLSQKSFLKRKAIPFPPSTCYFTESQNLPHLESPGKTFKVPVFRLRVCVLSHQVVSNSKTSWTIAGQAPPSTGFSRWEYWSGLPFPSREDLPNPGIKPTSPALAGVFFTTEPPEQPIQAVHHTKKKKKKKISWGDTQALLFFTATQNIQSEANFGSHCVRGLFKLANSVE